MAKNAIKLFGFPDARKMVFAQKRMLQGASSDMMDKMIFAGQNVVLNHLNFQDLAWTPLAVYTVSKKGNSLFLLDTYVYRDSIRAWKTKSKGFVGVKTTDTYPTGQKVMNVAFNNEYGTNRIPARPLWQPSMNDVKAFRASLSNSYLQGMLTKYYSK